MNSKTEKPKFFWRKNRKTNLKNSQNRKTENPNAPLVILNGRRLYLWLCSSKTRELELRTDEKQPQSSLHVFISLARVLFLISHDLIHYWHFRGTSSFTFILKKNLPTSPVSNFLSSSPTCSSRNTTTLLSSNPAVDNNRVIHHCYGEANIRIVFF